MKRCPACRRFLKVREHDCPFCGEAVAASELVASTPYAVALSLGLLVACGKSDDASADTDATSVSESGHMTGETSTAVDATGDGATTASDNGAGTEDSSDATESGPGFIYGGPFDVAVFECSVTEQNECGDAEKCAPWANDGGGQWNATRCAPVSPDAQPAGSSCVSEGFVHSGADDCDANSVCLYADASAPEGVCVPLCTHQSPACEGDQTCVPFVEQSFSLCLETCVPNDESQGCPEGESCVAFLEQFICVAED